MCDDHYEGDEGSQQCLIAARVGIELSDCYQDVQFNRKYKQNHLGKMIFVSRLLRN